MPSPRVSRDPAPPPRGRQRRKVHGMLCPEGPTMPAGGSSVRVVVGEPRAGPGPSSRGGGLKKVSRASLEGVSTRTRSAAAQHESCGLMRVTMGQPSRSCHGEGHVRWVSVPEMRPSGLSGYGERHVYTVSSANSTGPSAQPRQQKATGISQWWSLVEHSGRPTGVVVLRIVLRKMVGGKALPSVTPARGVRV